jgi:hypothetical protein
MGIDGDLIGVGLEDTEGAGFIEVLVDHEEQGARFVLGGGFAQVLQRG